MHDFYIEARFLEASRCCFEFEANISQKLSSTSIALANGCMGKRFREGIDSLGSSSYFLFVPLPLNVDKFIPFRLTSLAQVHGRLQPFLCRSWVQFLHTAHSLTLQEQGTRSSACLGVSIEKKSSIVPNSRFCACPRGKQNLISRFCNRYLFLCLQTWWAYVTGPSANRATKPHA